MKNLSPQFVNYLQQKSRFKAKNPKAKTSDLLLITIFWNMSFLFFKLVDFRRFTEESDYCATTENCRKDMLPRRIYVPARLTPSIHINQKLLLYIYCTIGNLKVSKQFFCKNLKDSKYQNAQWTLMGTTTNSCKKP